MKENKNVIIFGENSESSVQQVKKQRNSNLELYRIIVMLMIVAHHYVVNGSGLADIMYENPYNINTIFYRIFGAWGKTGINCFVLITGYFMCIGSITLRKFLKLSLEVIFYNIVIYVAFCLTDNTVFSFKEAFLSFVPVRSCNTGFTSAYILFYLAIPFLNILLMGLNKRSHLQLLALLLFIYTALPMMMANVSYNYFSWFIVLYFIASYIRRYGLLHNESSRFWGWATLAVFFISSISIVFPLLINHGCTYFFVSDSNHIMAILTAVTSFMFFKNLKIGYSKIINTVASTTFGVFLIHTRSEEMRHFLWNELFDNPGHYSTPIYAIGVVIFLFFTCSLLDFIRIKTIEKPLLNIVERACLGIYNTVMSIKK